MSGEKREKYSFVPIYAAVLVLLFGVAWIAIVQHNTEQPGTRTPSKFIFAPGFTGKVKIRYDMPEAPALEEADGYRVFRVPPSGQLDTSSAMLYGKADDKYLRETADGSMEDLGIQHLKMRKNGLIGDDKEYFESTSELAARDEWMKTKGMVDEEGNLKLGGAYEMMIIRDDF